MKTLRIALPAGARRCTVDPDELEHFARALLEDLLFEAARAAGDDAAAGSVAVDLQFTVRPDPDGGLRVIR